MASVTRLLSARLLTLELERSRRGERQKLKLAGPMKRSSSREPCLTLAQRFLRVSGTQHKVRVFKVWERREPIWLELAAITLAMAIGFSSRVESGTLENKPEVRSPQPNGGGERMLLYEMLIAVGVAVVLVVAAIDRFAARVMMGPEEMALLRLARAATAQRGLVASAAQQEREARAAAAQRAQRRLVAYWTHALAAPLPARLATLITQLETQDVSA